MGIDHRTVASCIEGRVMSWGVREALERGLSSNVILVPIRCPLGVMLGPQVLRGLCYHSRGHSAK